MAESSGDGILFAAGLLLLSQANQSVIKDKSSDTKTPPGGSGAAGGDAGGALATAGVVVKVVDQILQWVGVGGISGVVGVLGSKLYAWLTAPAGKAAASTGGAAGGALAAGAGGLAGLVVGVITVVLVVLIVIFSIIDPYIQGGRQYLKEQNDRTGKEMLEFEQLVWERMMELLPFGGRFEKVSVQDFRVNWKLPEQYNGPAAQGALPTKEAVAQYDYALTRPAFNFIPDTSEKPAWMGDGTKEANILATFRQLRAASVAYIQYRNELLSRVQRRLYPDDPAAMVLDDYRMNHEYENVRWIGSPPGVGGLLQLPLLDGHTDYNAAVPGVGACGRPCNMVEDPWATKPVPEVSSRKAQFVRFYDRSVFFRARDAAPDWSFFESKFGQQLVQAGRLRALVQAFALFQYDVTLIWTFTDGAYARGIVDALGIGSHVYFPPATNQEPWWAWTFVTKPEFFGDAYAFDCWKIRDMADAQRPSSRMFKRDRGVPIGDKRLDVIWQVT